MAEKRIVLTVDDGYCETECVYFPIACSDECEHIDKPTFSYTRQEAIERMAKAYCSFMWGDRYSWEEVPDENKKYFYNFATVGLNALLEEGK